MLGRGAARPSLRGVKAAADRPIAQREDSSLRILVIGAGVIGSVYAGLLADAGHDVTVVGRGGRLDNLRHQGLRLRSAGGMESRHSVSIVDAVPDTPLDLVVIAVRREQAVFAAAQAGRSNAIDALFFGNFAGMIPELGASIGSDRALAGFPGVGGRMERDGSVTYVVIGQQPTVVGTIGGSDKAAQSTATTLREAGFPTKLEPDINRWLGSHAALVAPMAAAVKAAGGRAEVLADRRDLLRMAGQATRAIYRHQRVRGELVASANLRLLYLVMPEWFAVRYWSRALRGDFGELAFAAHTRHAWGEMAALSEWLRSTLTDDPAALAALDRLLGVATDLNPSGDR